MLIALFMLILLSSFICAVFWRPEAPSIMYMLCAVYLTQFVYLYLPDTPPIYRRQILTHVRWMMDNGYEGLVIWSFIITPLSILLLCIAGEALRLGVTTANTRALGIQNEDWIASKLMER